MHSKAFRYLSLCSGIEAASVAWHSLGWIPVAFSEIATFPARLLATRFPLVPNLGDILTYEHWDKFRGVDVIVAGTPCQDFSIAGKRAGLSGERSGLVLELFRILGQVQPEWVVWENVPGVLSSHGGADFGAVLEGLDNCGYSCAWRVLDAQFFGVPQRRRRVFLVGHRGDWRPAAAVLFEREGVRRGTPQSRRPRQEAAASTAEGIGDAGYISRIVSQAMSCKWSKGYSGPSGDEWHNLIAPTMMASGPPYSCTGNYGMETDALVVQAGQVRRFTPLECERLMGFPDGYTDIPGASDTARYKALGNSMAVPVMQWIGRRISLYSSCNNSCCGN